MVFDPDRQLAVAGEQLTAQEQFMDAVIRHQIGLLRVAGGIGNRVVELLDQSEADLRRRIRDAHRKGLGFAATSQVRRLRRLLGEIEALRAEAWISAEDAYRSELRDLAIREPRFIDGIYKTTMPVLVGTQLPSAGDLTAIVTAQPLAGRTLREWVRSAQLQDFARIRSEINIGLTQGETGPQIARRIVGRVTTQGRDGVTQISRRDARTIARTTVNSIGNHARQMYAAENAEFFPRELYIATLDERTTRVCAQFDGQRFPVNEGPIPPLHPNCRSLRTPLPDPEPIFERPAKAFTQRMLLREYTEMARLARVTKRSNLPRGHRGRFDAFARRRKRELIGQVPAKVTFQRFLERQSAEFQDDYLGRTLGRLFRSGLPLTRTVDFDGRPLRLDELAALEADIFRAAGLDPQSFL